MLIWSDGVNWLKIALLDRDKSISLVDGKLYFHDDYHLDFLARYFNITKHLAGLTRFMFPRGRCINDFKQVVVECSPELKMFQTEIMNRLNIPFNAKWDFSNDHYTVRNEQDIISYTKEYIEGASLYDMLSINEIDFIKEYLPQSYAWAISRFGQLD